MKKTNYILWFAAGFVAMAVLMVLYVYATVNTAVAQIAGTAMSSVVYNDGNPTAGGYLNLVRWPWSWVLKGEAAAVNQETNEILTEYFDAKRDAAGDSIAPLEGASAILGEEGSEFKSIWSDIEGGSTTS